MIRHCRRLRTLASRSATAARPSSRILPTSVFGTGVANRIRLQTRMPVGGVMTIAVGVINRSRTHHLQALVRLQAARAGVSLPIEKFLNVPTETTFMFIGDQWSLIRFCCAFLPKNTIEIAPWWYIDQDRWIQQVAQCRKWVYRKSLSTQFEQCSCLVYAKIRCFD